MKKILLVAVFALSILAVSSCDTKTCKCYYYDGVNPAYMEYEYTNESNSCSYLDYKHNLSYRKCIEYNEPDLDPGSIAEEFKKN